MTIVYICTIDVIVSACRKTVYKLKASKNKQPIDHGTFWHGSPVHELINEVLSSEVSLCLYKSAILPCMEYCCHFWAGAPSWYLKLLFKLHKHICRTVGPSLAVSLLNPCLMKMYPDWVFSIGITSGDVHVSWFSWFHFLVLREGLPVILTDWIIFLSPFLDVTGISISTISFLVLLDSGILMLWMLSFDVWFEWL